MTKNKGRGIFATKDIPKNEILIVEKPLVVTEVMRKIEHVHLSQDAEDEMFKTSIESLSTKIKTLMHVKSATAKRLTCLYYGQPKEKLEVPDAGLFINNKCRHLKISPLSNAEIT